MKSPDIILDELIQADEDRRIETLALQRAGEINEDYEQASTHRMIGEYSRTIQETLVGISTSESKHPLLHKIKKLGATVLGKDLPTVHQEYYIPGTLLTFLEEKEPEENDDTKSRIIKGIKSRTKQRLRNSPPVALVSDRLYETSYVHENRLRRLGLRAVIIGQEHGLFDEDEFAGKGYITLESPENDDASITIDRIHEDVETGYYRTNVVATADNQGRIFLPENSTGRSEEDDQLLVLGLLASFTKHYRVTPKPSNPNLSVRGAQVNVPLQKLSSQSYSAWLRGFEIGRQSI